MGSRFPANFQLESRMIPKHVSWESNQIWTDSWRIHWIQLSCRQVLYHLWACGACRPSPWFKRLSLVKQAGPLQAGSWHVCSLGSTHQPTSLEGKRLRILNSAIRCNQHTWPFEVHKGCLPIPLDRKSKQLWNKLHRISWIILTNTQLKTGWTRKTNALGTCLNIFENSSPHRPPIPTLRRATTTGSWKCSHNFVAKPGRKPLAAWVFKVLSLWWGGFVGITGGCMACLLEAGWCTF